MDVVVIEADEGMIALLPPGVMPEEALAALPVAHPVTFLASGSGRPVAEPDLRSYMPGR